MSSPFAPICIDSHTLISGKVGWALASHPDRAYAAYIVQGIQLGFRIGFRVGEVTCQSTHTNMPSASHCVCKIDEFFATECAAGRILGPFDHSLLPMLHVNRLGAVPISTPGRYRLIIDLSFPEGHSPNNGISEALCSLSYTSVEDAAQSVLRLAGGHSWPRWIFAMPIGTCRCIQMIAGCWV